MMLFYSTDNAFCVIINLSNALDKAKYLDEIHALGQMQSHIIDNILLGSLCILITKNG